MDRRRMKLSSKVLAVGLITVIAFVGLLAFLYPQVRKMAYEGKREKTKSLVETAVGILHYYDGAVQRGELKMEEAKKQAGKELEALRFDETNYFFIADFNHVFVMHPLRKDLVGKENRDLKDAKGGFFLQDIVKVGVEKGEGMVDYWWVKPNDKDPSPKISYVKAFKPWGWIASTGIYVDDVERQLNHWLFTSGVVALAITIGSLFFAFWMGRSISRPIAQVSKGLAEGAGQVASASSQISGSSQSLAEGASEQAAAIEETSSSIEEMASMARQNADNASQANTLMGSINGTIEGADRSMKELTASMGEITRASEETGKIIKTIDEIAFQTNLLALNAAVEAARAGEAGAGFAVVADEVRNLAMRAAEAAKNTSGLIEGTVKKVRHGSETVSKTNGEFAKVSEGAKKVKELVGEIAAASQEQAQGVEQINKAVAEMDKVVQRNAASAEESASASEEMNGQAEQMKEFVAELAALVDGGGNRNGSRPVEGRRAEASALSKKGIAAGRGQVARSTALVPKVRSAEPPTAYRVGKEVSPEQVIPMGEDFKGF